MHLFQLFAGLYKYVGRTQRPAHLLKHRLLVHIIVVRTQCSEHLLKHLKSVYVSSVSSILKVAPTQASKKGISFISFIRVKHLESVSVHQCVCYIRMLLKCVSVSWVFHQDCFEMGICSSVFHQDASEKCICFISVSSGCFWKVHLRHQDATEKCICVSSVFHQDASEKCICVSSVFHQDASKSASVSSVFHQHASEKCICFIRVLLCRPLLCRPCNVTCSKLARTVYALYDHVSDKSLQKIPCTNTPYIYGSGQP